MAFHFFRIDPKRNSRTGRRLIRSPRGQKRGGGRRRALARSIERRCSTYPAGASLTTNQASHLVSLVLSHSALSKSAEGELQVNPGLCKPPLPSLVLRQRRVAISS